MAVEREAEFLENLVAAHERDIAAPVIEDDLVADHEHVGFSQSRIRTARSWLFALGYLDRDEDRSDYDDTLRRALKLFQTEAGLTVDGWIGTEETWPRLRELVTFDDPLLQAHWITPSGRARTALARAAKTRLVLYGFGKRDDAPMQVSLDKQMKRFFGVLKNLGALPSELPTRRADKLAFILSHDDHVAAIAQGLETTAVTDLFVHFGKHKKSIKAYALLLNLTKVELWLAQIKTISLGERYHVTLGFDDKFTIPGDLRKGMNEYFNNLADDETEVTVRPTVWQHFRAGYTIVHVEPGDRLAALGPTAAGASVDRGLHLARIPVGLLAGAVVYITDSQNSYFRVVEDVRDRTLWLDRHVGTLATRTTKVRRAGILAVTSARERPVGEASTPAVDAAGDWGSLINEVVGVPLDDAIAPHTVKEYRVMSARFVPAEVEASDATDAGFVLKGGYTELDLLEREPGPSVDPAKISSLFTPSIGASWDADLYLEKRGSHLPPTITVEKPKKTGAGDFAVMRHGLDDVITILKEVDKPAVLVPGNGESDVELREA
ncbi:MAG: peptidoglycan-binding protein, partial [Proteobacteria bacterium]|nr:peptidoglycan-binding protein [Pseudomonadota bacterium]